MKNWIIHEIPVDFLSSISVDPFNAQLPFHVGTILDFSFVFLPTQCVEMASWGNCVQVPN